MISPLLALKFMLFIGSIRMSLQSIAPLKKKPNCSACDKNCVNDRSQRDATLIIDYGNRHVVCDEDHPFLCDIVDPLYGINEKLKKISTINEFTGKVLPFDVRKQMKKRNYESSQGNEHIKSVEKSKLPNSDGFICAAYGFFPGIIKIHSRKTRITANKKNLCKIS